MNTGLRHGAGFITSGALAFTTDAAMLALLTRVFGFDPFLARLLAIAVAMVVGFFAHRRLTFAVTEPPTFPQFSKFLGVAATASVINYAIYAAVLVLRPATDPLIALLIATAAAMLVSYGGLRFGVFRKPPAE
jgi:putative flippase GtrA